MNKFEEVLINIGEFEDKFCTIVQGQKKGEVFWHKNWHIMFLSTIAKLKGLKPNSTSHADDVILHIQEEVTLPVEEVLTGCLYRIEVRYNSGKWGQEGGV